MENKTKVIIAAVVVTTAFAVGRFSAPTKIKTETKIVEVEKKTSEKESDNEKKTRKKTVTKEVKHPDGSTESSTETTEETESSKKKRDKNSEESSRTEKETKEVTREGGKIIISAIAAGRLQSPLASLLYGAVIQKEILGPATAGVFILTNGQIGVTVGLSF